MRVIVAGSRGFSDSVRAFDCLDRLNVLCSISAVVCGMAAGADTLGRLWAVSRGVPVVEMPADWDTHGKSAGYKRNEEMARVADYLLAFWDGSSRGTKHMIDLAEKYGLTITVVRYQGAI